MANKNPRPTYDECKKLWPHLDRAHYNRAIRAIIWNFDKDDPSTVGPNAEQLVSAVKQALSEGYT